MKISASLFSKKGSLEAYANQLEYTGVDLVHIDYLDGAAKPVPITSLTPEITKTPYDVHIITSHLHRNDVKMLNETTTLYLTIQYENLKDKQDLEKLSLFEGRKGIGFTIATPIEIIEHYVPSVDFIMIMCSEPGVSGAKFDERNMERIRYLKETYPHLSIHVDGGIDNERVAIMENLGVQLCVSGSYLAATDGLELIQRVCELKFIDMNIKVSNIMIPSKCVQTLNQEADFYAILENINDSQMGIAIVQDDNKFMGIITDGDVRRSLIKHRESCFSFHVKDIVNAIPYTADKNELMYDVLYKRMLLEKNVAIVPVLDGEQFVGILDMKKIF